MQAKNLERARAKRAETPISCSIVAKLTTRRYYNGKDSEYYSFEAGNCYPDPIATAKVQGTHFTDACKHTEIHDTPDSKPSANDLDSPREWAPINKAAVPNTYTRQGGSKRD